MNKPKMAEDFSKSVKEMMEAFGQGVNGEGWTDLKTGELRVELLNEEFYEYLRADVTGDRVEVADALGDMCVIIFGTALSYGIDLPAVLAEIQRSNMTKIDPETGRVKKREDGKVLKPKTYEPPNIKSVMEASDE